MRQKLNENPVVQAVAIGLLALLVAVMLLMRMGGGGGAEAPPAPGDTGTLTPPAADPAAVATPGAAVDSVSSTPTAAPPTEAGSTAPPSSETGSAELEAGPGLPAPVADAYNDGHAIGLLIVNRRGIDDRELARTVASVGSQAGVTMFTTEVADVADYSRITEGVDVDRTPALVVIRPKHLTEGSMPVASVAYGFRGAGSVRQAFEDALYSGPDGLPYYP